MLSMIGRLAGLSAILAFCVLAARAGAAETIDISRAQTELARIGCYDGEVDGKASLAFRSAVRCFQKTLDGAEPDGRLTAAQFDALKGSLRVAPVKPAAGVFVDVRDAKVELKRIGCYRGAIDDRKDEAYRAAVLCFRKPHPDTDFLGPMTPAQFFVLQNVADGAYLRLDSATPAELGKGPVDVAEGQRELARVGCYEGEIDGRDSPAYREAVRCFQVRRKLRGAADELTLEQFFHLRKVADGAYAEKPAPVNLYKLAREAGLVGLPPDLEGDPGEERARRARRVAWDNYGLQIRDFNGRGFIASLRPDGPAMRQGAKVGDVMNTVNSVVGRAGPAHRAMLDAFERETGDGSVEFKVFDADSRWRNAYRIYPTGRAGAGDAPALPPALVAVTEYPGLMAIWRHDLSKAEPGELVRDAMLALQGISGSGDGCAAGRPAVIPIKVSVTKERRSGLGVYKGSSTESYGEALKVHPVLAGWARASLGYYSTAVVSDVRIAVSRLVVQDGCDGPGLRRLMRGIAMVASAEEAFDAAMPAVAAPAAGVRD